MRVAEDDIQIDIKLFSSPHNEHLLTAHGTVASELRRSFPFFLMHITIKQSTSSSSSYALVCLSTANRAKRSLLIAQKKAAQKEVENGKVS